MPNADDETTSQLTGLTVGFEAYLTIPDTVTQAALMGGLVAIDTNVLLNLYRYGDSARDDLLKVLGALGHRLFIPHQVALEFWRRRESGMRDRVRMATSTVSALEDARDSAEKAIREWANRLAISDATRSELLQELACTIDTILEIVESSGATGTQPQTKDTTEDTVLNRVTAILDGKVGKPMAEAERTACVAEGLRRVDKRIPPGYKDKSKEGDNAAGDYLVWEQSLREAKRRAKDIVALVFITADTAAEDWYRKDGGEIRGPRAELYDEARRVAGVPLILLTPSSLIFHAQAALSVEIGSDTVANIERAAEITRADDRDGWTDENMERFIDLLWKEAPVQCECLMTAADNGGFISRDEVYKIGRYHPDRTLRGFTRPARRLMQGLQDRGLLAYSVAEPLQTVYDSKESYVIASGFRVPEEFCGSHHLSDADTAQGSTDGSEIDGIAGNY